MNTVGKNISPPLPGFRGLRFISEQRFYHSCPPSLSKELAIIGRSNAGKSSLINRLAGEKSLARVSSTPGRTQGLVFFGWPNRDQLLVDLPGYGYAKASRGARRNWRDMIEDYLFKRPNLQALVLVMDCRRELAEEELMLLELAWVRECAICVAFNKCDKLSNNQLAQQRFKLQNAVQSAACIKQRMQGVAVISCSAANGLGCNTSGGVGEWMLHQLGIES